MLLSPHWWLEHAFPFLKALKTKGMYKYARPSTEGLPLGPRKDLPAPPLRTLYEAQPENPLRVEAQGSPEERTRGGDSGA
jgi:hypothetical protein